MDRDEDFTDFVQARSTRLLQFAWMLCGDKSQAEDLVQSALEKVYPHWDRVRAGDPYAYVRRAVTNHHLSWLRRRIWRERPVGGPPELDRTSRGAAPDGAEAISGNLAITQALTVLTQRERSVVVLRYLEDLSEKETAAVLGVAVGTVKSVTFRALRKLRTTSLDASMIGEQR
ncbi:RNA polymerase sigma-70 factor (sigma-E family) [Kribbella amoyensis]|uniref:RNA polymerase sigma-70 factor (Sigma-E family) n=1 Tax=Kribbella amoyensis TaxID=996641 RepID=A0A561BUS7_9ACTN|nr:SigE family RNA polymerase sigma factor [Kribbella amoyensis]TWD82561.1 RNA polymerase sigma-70 factor (sigma-E family) [Kribbella amoyensis]